MPYKWDYIGFQTKLQGSIFKPVLIHFQHQKHNSPKENGCDMLISFWACPEDGENDMNITQAVNNNITAAEAFSFKYLLLA